MTAARAGNDSGVRDSGTPDSGTPDSETPDSETNDVRGRGFASRVALSIVEEWIDASVVPLPPRVVALADAASALGEGVVLAEPVTAPGDWPPADRAASAFFAA